MFLEYFTQILKKRLRYIQHLNKNLHQHMLKVVYIMKRFPCFCPTKSFLSLSSAVLAALHHSQWTNPETKCCPRRVFAFFSQQITFSGYKQTHTYTYIHAQKFIVLDTHTLTYIYICICVEWILPLNFFSPRQTHVLVWRIRWFVLL